jgi:Skp family chaperone for outer membrane proteins
MMNFQRLGWVVAAGVLGIIAATGFQGSLDKVATVDLQTMVENSDLGKSNIGVLDKMKTLREDLLRFVDDNRVLTMDQARNLRTLWLKESPTPQDKANLDSLKADVSAAAAKNVALGQKKDLTPEERTLLQDYASRSSTMEQIVSQWYQEFSQEIQGSAQQRRVDTLTKAKASAQAVARLQGYTLVFDSTVGVYAANDLTEDALKSMNAKK